MKCNTCQNKCYCNDGNHELTRYGCTNNGFAAYVPQTNADRVRAMTDEELAEFMEDAQTWGGCPNHGARDCTQDCGSCWAVWLKSPVEVEDERV